MTTAVETFEKEIPAEAGLDEDALALPPLATEGHSSTNLTEVVRAAFSSLASNKTRAILTMLGVVIGVASVVALLAIGSGASSYITGQVSSLGTNLLTIMPSSPNSRGPGQGSTSPQTLTMDDFNAIVSLGLPLKGIAPQFSGQADVVAAAADKNASLTGTTLSYFTINDLAPSAGTLWDTGQERTAAPVVVLGSNLAKDLFGSGQAVGQMVRVKDQPLRVIGVLKSKGGNGFGSVDDQAFVPIKMAQQRLFGARTPDGNGYRVNSISLSANNSSDLNAIQSRVTLLLREQHHISKTDGSEDDFMALNQASMLSILGSITNMLTLFLGAIAGISLLVGGIGIMNIMLVSVTERTREIGLRKAVGARGGDILLQFIVEAVVISLVGGLLGLGLGGLIALVVKLTGLLDPSVTLGSVALALGFSTGVGLFFGIYPARRAAQLDPIQALHYE